MDFDRSSRYLITAELLRGLCPPPGPVLEVGGSDGLLPVHLDEYEIVVCDVRGGDVAVLARGEQLPFRDRSFAMVVALDVLEHVAQDVRRPLVAEIGRVAQGGVILAGPYETTEVLEAERSARDAYVAMSGRQHRWLKEHLEHGLPSAEEVADHLERLGFTVGSIGTNPVEVWTKLQLLNFAAAKTDQRSHAEALHSDLETHFLGAGDQTGHPYRRIVLGLRSQDPVASLSDLAKRIAPEDGWSIPRASKAIDSALASIIRESAENTARLERIADHSRTRQQELRSLVQSLGRELRREQARIDRLKDRIERDKKIIKQAGVANQTRRASGDQPSERQAPHDLVAAYAAYIQQVEPAVLADLERESDGTARLHTIVDTSNGSGSSVDGSELQATIHCAIPLGPVTVLSDASIDAVIEIEGKVRVRPEAELETALVDLADQVDFVAVVSPGDLLRTELSTALASHSTSTVSAVTFDHDVIDEKGLRSDPSFKPSFSPDWLVEHDYVGRAAVFDPRALCRVGIAGLSRSQPHRDLLIRLWEQGHSPARIEAVLLHCRHPAIATGEEDSQFAQDVAVRRGLPATAVRSGRESIELRYPVPPHTKVSIIVPFKDKPRLLNNVVDSIRRLTSYTDYELVLVDNGSANPATRALIDRLASASDIKIVRYDEEFNYSRANNLGAATASGDVLVFLNNDTEVVSPDWLEILAGQALREGVGAVGALLQYRDGSIQHAGVVIGLAGMASHLFSGLEPNEVPGAWIDHAREVTAVTGACLAVDRDAFVAVGGFDESFELTGSDVDFCLRLIRAGYRNLIDPRARLIHLERRTRRGLAVRRNDQWRSFYSYHEHLRNGDSYFNANLSRQTSALVPRTSDEPGLEALRARLFPISEQHRSTRRLLAQFDTSTSQIEASRRTTAGSATSHGRRVETATWFLSPFTHVYRGGIYTALRVADHLTERFGTHHRLVICGEPDTDVASRAKQIAEAFPALSFDMTLLPPGAEPDTMPPTDIAVCTLWKTAYALLKFNRCDQKYYFVQDYEPLFSRADAIYGLVETTYRFGFHGIANTKGVADAYRAYGNDCVHFTPGIDHDLFHPGEEAGGDRPLRIVFYGRPSRPRNGFELGAAALTELKARHGDDVEIVSVGARFQPAAFSLEGVLENRGVLPTILDVARLYRSSDIGLVFMFTKHPSYQPLEYMASGCATVTNRNEANSWLFEDGRNALLTIPTVSSVADALGRLIEDTRLRSTIVAGGLATAAEMRWAPALRRVSDFMLHNR